MAVARGAGYVADGRSDRAPEDDTVPARPPTDDPAPAPPHVEVVGAFRSGVGTPVFAAPGLVLVATLAIFEGYHWLHLIPDGPVRPTAVVLALVVVPATFALTQRISGPGTGLVRLLARGCAVLLPMLWVVLLFVHDDLVSGMLGVVSLALALSLVALAVLSEVAEHRATGNY